MNTYGVHPRTTMGSITPASPPPSKPGSKRTSENDSMSLHLLVEQAIYDSADCEVLSFEEVESLKKEQATLTIKIDTMKQKLSMESKVRDAALSLSRLSSKRGRKTPTSPVAQEGEKKTDDEYAASCKKCDELASELQKLEARGMVIQRCLLQHSVGILVSAHKASKSSSTNGGFGFAEDPQAFDDRSFYRTADKLDGFGDLRASVSSASGKKMMQDSLIAAKLEEVNEQISTLLRESGNDEIPEADGRSLDDQLSFLENNIQFLRQFPPTAQGDAGDNSAAAHELERIDGILSSVWDMIASHEEEVKEIKMMQPDNDDYPESDFEDLPAYSVSAFASKVQKMLTKMATLRSERDRLRESSTQQDQNVEEDMKIMQEELKGMESQVAHFSELLEQRETDLNTANALVQTLSEELKQKTEELKAAMNQLETERSRAAAAGVAVAGAAAVAATSDSTAALEKEIAALDQRLSDRERSLSELHNKYADMKQDRDMAREQLLASEAANKAKFANLTAEIIDLQEARKAAEDANGHAIQHAKNAQQQLSAKDFEIQKLDKEVHELSGKLAELSMELVMAKAELDSSYGSKSERAAATAEAKAAAVALERAKRAPNAMNPGLKGQLEDMERHNIELINEIVMLKNERAEGANNEHFQQRAKLLQKELDDMMREHEILIRQNIEAEKTQGKLEKTVDMLKEKLEAMETALAEEKIKYLGATPTQNRNGSFGDVRSPGFRTVDATSIQVLRAEFKKMMKDMRADQYKILKASEEERRRLENMVRVLRKEQLKRMPGAPPAIPSKP
ncbi:Up-regulated during septation-domain-containing protein [Pyronema omphalodes]|nr:Up-regulated during septation-domain-containing protein [Pyronema omphalodes]